MRGVFFGMKHALRTWLAGLQPHHQHGLTARPQAVSAQCLVLRIEGSVVALTTASVAHEVATTGVTVNAVCPGATDTPVASTGK